MKVWMERADGFAKPGDRQVAGIAHGFEDVTDRPAPTIVANRAARVLIEHGEPSVPPPSAGKPAYRVPTMAEIRALPWNGLTVASTFAGTGGSSTGYRMAGYRVAYANEFVDAARASYAANKAEHTVLDGRDIRTVSAADVLAACKLGVGELDVLDGSPPCSAFSTAGKRESGWGKAKSYSDDKHQVVDDLFFEFARLVRGVRPRVFVAENVSGLVKGTAKGYFLEILAALKACGYRVEAKLLDAQWLGVPQARQRLIFVGVREDLDRAPAFPTPLAYRYTIRDALPWMERVSGGNAGAFDAKTRVYSCDEPAPTILARANRWSGGTDQFTVDRVVGFTTKGGVQHPVDEPAPTVMTHGRRGTQSEFCAVVEPESDMTRYAVGAEWAKLKPGGRSDKYFQLVRPHPDAPSPTVTAAAGGASTAGVTHPTECRKLSIAELKRICGFPDDFKLLGSYQQQWERCGRAVPPVMMAAVASAVRDRVLRP